MVFYALPIVASPCTRFFVQILPKALHPLLRDVGKSSLMNSLLGRKKLARVSAEPGKTITVNYYEVDGKLMLVDLPGYGFARRPKVDIEKWSALTQQYFENNDALKCVLQLVDIRIGLTADDRMMLDYLGTKFNCPEASKLNETITQAVRNTYAPGKLLPHELGDTASMNDIFAAVSAELEKLL